MRLRKSKLLSAVRFLRVMEHEGLWIIKWELSVLELYDIMDSALSAVSFSRVVVFEVFCYITPESEIKSLGRWAEIEIKS